jgi:hypothetical protein
MYRWEESPAPVIVAVSQKAIIVSQNVLFERQPKISKLRNNRQSSLLMSISSFQSRNGGSGRVFIRTSSADFGKRISGGVLDEKC